MLLGTAITLSACLGSGPWRAFSWQVVCKWCCNYPENPKPQHSMFDGTFIKSQSVRLIRIANIRYEGQSMAGFTSSHAGTGESEEETKRSSLKVKQTGYVVIHIFRRPAAVLSCIWLRLLSCLNYMFMQAPQIPLIIRNNNFRTFLTPGNRALHSTSLAYERQNHNEILSYSDSRSDFLWELSGMVL